MFYDYDGWGFKEVESFKSLAEQKEMVYHGELDNDMPHTEIDSFFLEEGQDPVELLLPSCS